MENPPKRQSRTPRDVGVDQADAIEDQEAGQGLRTRALSLCNSALSSLSRPYLQGRHHLFNMYDRSSYWVYGSFVGKDWEQQFFYAFEVYDLSYVPLPQLPTLNTFLNSATAVFHKRLYVIGGESNVMFDLVLYTWMQVTPTLVARPGALAITAGGKVYVFGGCINESAETNTPWDEVYEPSTELWTPIPGSQTLTDALHNGISMLKKNTVVFGNKILIKAGIKNGIALDIRTYSWSAILENLLKHWWNTARAAVVKNLLITCYCEEGLHNERLELRIQAYDPQNDLWLTIQGLDRSFHENATKSNFLSVNGKMEIYNMVEPQDDWNFFIIDIHERLVSPYRTKFEPAQSCNSTDDENTD